MWALWGDLAAAFGLLTRLPLGSTRAPSAREVWAYPIVGAVVGALGGLVYALAHVTRLPDMLSALLALAATILFTGGLHEDGLADTADGFGGGATREKKLAIMRDSRIGTFGALALVFGILIRASAIAALSRPTAVVAGMVFAATAGRTVMAVLLRPLGPARADGMAAGLGRPSNATVAFVMALPLAETLGLFPPGIAFVACAAATVCALGVAWGARRAIGGHTGDVLGAAEVVTECVALTVLVAGMRQWATSG